MVSFIEVIHPKEFPTLLNFGKLKWQMVKRTMISNTIIFAAEKDPPPHTHKKK